MNAEKPESGCCAEGTPGTKGKCCPFSDGKMSMLLSVVAIILSLMALFK